MIRLSIPLLLALAPVVLAHPDNSPTAWVDVEIDDLGLTLSLTARREVLGRWIDLDLSLERPTSADADEEVRAAVRALFTAENTVTIDGEHARPQVESILPPEDFEDHRKEQYLRVELRYASATRPRRVKVLWQTYRGAFWLEDPVVPGLFKSGPATDAMTFSADDPEYTWHPRTLRPGATPLERVESPPPPEPAPYLSLALGAAALLVAVLLRRRRPAAAAVLLLGATGVALAWPAAAGAAEPPPPEQALKLFKTLHGNVYRAFEAETEDEIYDLLALSVEGALLEQTYLDIYESLIMRGQGGVVTKVDRIEVLDGKVTVPEEKTAEFHVHWKWRLFCSVSHWGHTHGRINSYAADYVVRHDGRSWKIAAVTIQEQEREDLDTEDR